MRLSIPFLFLLLGACGRDTPSVTGDGAAPLLVEGETPSESAGLAVAFRARGPDGALPTELAFTTNLPVFPADAVGRPAPEGTQVTFDPPVAGTLEVAARDVLVFRPDAPLPPATTWTVRLDAIGKVADPPEDWRAAWSPRTTTFSTPAFTFLGASLPSWDRARRRAELVLAFTGPVDPEAVAGRLRITFDDTPVGPAAVEPGGTPNTVRVRLEHPGLAAADEQDHALGVQVAEGVPLVGLDGVLAPAGEDRVPLVAAATPAKVLAVKVREGVSGFYLDVLCDDGAVEQKRWWWDRETWDDYRVSERCMLDEESVRRSLRLTPALETTVVASGSGFRVFAPFTAGSVQLTLDEGARTVDGGVFPTTVQETLDIPHRTPRVQFAQKGRYLPRSAWTNLGLRATNVPEVEVTVRHVPAENLVFWMTGQEPADARVSDVVATRRVRLPAPIDEPADAWLDVGSLVPDAEPGVYEITVAGYDRGAEPAPTAEAADPDTGFRPVERASGRGVTDARDTARLLLTDLHLVAKLAAPEQDGAWSPRVWGWTLDVHDNEAVSGVELSLVKPSGRTVSRCVTGGNGGCELAVPADPLDPTPPVALIARKGRELTYLEFEDLRVDLPADVAGESGSAAPRSRAAVWPERGVYRPGETAHVAALVREPDFKAPKADVPVLMKLFDPRGKEIRRRVVDTDEAGLVTWDVGFGDYASTGRYRVAAELGGVEVGQASLQVEEFVPERMKVTAAAKKPAYRLGDPMEVDVTGAWLFGGTAAGARVELSCQVEPGAFTPPANANFHYGPAALAEDVSRRPLTLGLADAALDDEGRVTLACPAAGRGAALDGPATLVARASVFEGSSGRTTVAEARAPVHPTDRYVGLRTSARQARTGQAFTVEGVVVDWSGRPIAGTSTLDVELVRLEEEFGWTWDETEQTSAYRRMLRRAREGTVRVPVADGAFSVPLTPAADGAGYLVAVRLGGAVTELHVPGERRRWWWSSLGDTVDQTPRPQAPTLLPIELPASAKTGETVTASFVAPYAGRALVSVESRGVVRAEWMDVTAGPVQWRFSVDRFEPNVYVSALVLKDPHLESPQAFLPDRAFGVANLRIEPTAYTQPVKLVVPPEARPNAPLTVELDLGPLAEPAWATVAAVDEGILQLTRHPDPDPARAIFARRALGVQSFETVGWTLLHQPGGPSARTGGDAAGAGQRVQMVKPVALWSGKVGVPASGKVKVTFDVPSYRGSLRVMAVVATPTKMGSAAASVPVREPLVLQSTLPRFLVSGDLAQVPVMVTNLSGKAQTVTVRMAVEDLARPEDTLLVDVAPGARPRAAGLAGAQEGKLALAPDVQGTVVFRLRGDHAPGAVRVKVEARAGSLSSTETLEVPVVLAEPEVEETHRIPLDAATVDLAPLLADWKDGSDRTTVWVTRNPYAEALTHLKYLVRYPYGCIEQTTSSTRPLLYVKTLAPDLVRTVAADRTLDDMVTHGVQRVLAMQTPSGGFSYWPGGGSPVVWGSTYGTHLLLDARDAGYAVPAQAVDDAVGWLVRQLDRPSGVSEHERAYAHYLVARAGRPQLAAARRLVEELEGRKSDRGEDLYLARAAVQLGGDRRYEAQLRRPPVPSVTLRRANDWSYWSDLREAGLVLSVFRELFQEDVAGQALADAVAAGLVRRKASAWYTTQELAWGITGLAKSVAAPQGGVSAPTLTVDGKAVAALEGKGGAQWTWSLSRATQARTLALGGDPGAGLYAVVTVAGQKPTAKAPSGMNGVVIRREWLDGDGDPIDRRRIPLGEALYVRLTVENPLSLDTQNLAVVDRVPAGFEIENPRLGRGALPDWVDPDQQWRLDHMDVRDDRLAVFGALPARTRVEVVYMVRAVTAGTFTAPETWAEAMYDPEIRARLLGETVEVVGPWEGMLL